jgi:membrane protein DedA with SNARE-associated domain
VNEFIDWLNTSVQNFDPLWRNVIAGFAIMLETSIFIGLIVPGDTVVLAAGTLIQDWGDYGLLFLAVMVGSFLGESIGFWIGRVFGVRIRASKMGQRIAPHIWHRADTFVESKGGLAIAMSRFLPVLHSVVPVTAGMSKMTYKTFISWTVSACALWSAIYLGIGWFARGASEAVNQFKFGGVIIIAIIVTFLVLSALLKKRLDKSATAMIDDAEKAKSRAKKIRNAEMKRPNL